MALPKKTIAPGIFKDEVEKLKKENERLARHNDRLKTSERAANIAHQEALDSQRKRDEYVERLEESVENYREARERLRKKLQEAVRDASEELMDDDLADRILANLQKMEDELLDREAAIERLRETHLTNARVIEEKYDAAEKVKFRNCVPEWEPPDPDSMHGAADGFGGSDYPDGFDGFKGKK